MSIIDETCVSQQTYLANLEGFPDKYKIKYINAVQSDQSDYDKIFIVYYNDYVVNKLFSFEHMCFELNKITEISMSRLIQNYKKTNQWDLSEIPLAKINYLLGKLLCQELKITCKPRNNSLN